jgi:hypothetical protein
MTPWLNIETMFAWLSEKKTGWILEIRAFKIPFITEYAFAIVRRRRDSNDF